MVTKEHDMETKTIKELLAMTGAERTAYLLSLSGLQRVRMNTKLFRAIAEKTVQKLEDNSTHQNVKEDDS